jgi:RNA polymerase sigma factor (sigma-70 family)
MNDKELIFKLKQPNSKIKSEALSFLIKRDMGAVENYILNNKGKDVDAQDIFQEALIVLIRNIEENKYKESSSLKSYLFAISRNLWLKQLNKKKVQKEVYMEHSNIPEITMSEDTINTVEDELSLKSMNEQFKKLGSECQELLMMFYYESKKMKDIQNRFNLGSEQAAKNKKMRCIQYLIQLMKDK